MGVCCGRGGGGGAGKGRPGGEGGGGGVGVVGGGKAYEVGEKGLVEGVIVLKGWLN